MQTLSPASELHEPRQLIDYAKSFLDAPPIRNGRSSCYTTFYVWSVRIYFKKKLEIQKIYVSNDFKL